MRQSLLVTVNFGINIEYYIIFHMIDEELYCPLVWKFGWTAGEFERRSNRHKRNESDARHFIRHTYRLCERIPEESGITQEKQR